MRVCWCGSAELSPFSSQYGECKVCGTLVSIDSLTDDQLLVQDDESDFYGKQYWKFHQESDLGFPDIEARARNDLIERNLHWLKTLLKYRLPPANVMELGCAHGSFVALMTQAGYQASGVEMSPWVVEFGKNAFAIDMKIGPVENLDIEAGSFDVIALMDVLEHLPDPIGTMKYCLSLLSPDGLLLIQTPQFREETLYNDLVEESSSFLSQLKADEHLYLFSERSVTELFSRLDANHICFEPAIFSHYDMFFAVSRKPLSQNSSEQIEGALLSTPSGRIALALLDLSEVADSALSSSQQDTVNLLHAQLADLQRNFDAVEADRVVRGEVIKSQGEMVSVLHKEVDDRLSELTELYRLKNLVEGKLSSCQRQVSELQLKLQGKNEEYSALEGQCSFLKAGLSDVENALERAEADRIARGEVIEEQGKTNSELQKAISLVEENRDWWRAEAERLQNEIEKLRDGFEAE